MPNNENSIYRILVIDDASADREIFRLMLTKEGYLVDTVSSAEKGFECLNAREYDLILCDYFMPDVDGEGFLVKLREDPRLKHLVVVIITSDESKEVKVRLLRKGANDFLHKGAAYEEIVARVAAHLNAKHLANSNMILDFAGSYVNEMSQPLANMIASCDLFGSKCAQIQDAQQREELQKMVSYMNESINRMTGLLDKIRQLELETKKHYTVKK